MGDLVVHGAELLLPVLDGAVQFLDGSATLRLLHKLAIVSLPSTTIRSRISEDHA